MEVEAGDPSGSSPALAIGILGAARIATNGIVRPGRETGNRLAGIAARDPARARQFAAEHGVERVFDSYQELIESPTIDVVYNPLPNSMHAQWNLAAIAAGRHVLSEKPFAANAREAALVRDAGKEAGVRVVDGFHYVYHPVTRRVEQLATEGELGEIIDVKATLVIPRPAAGDPRLSLALAGGALMDAGCYGLHVIRRCGAHAGGAPDLVEIAGVEFAGLPGIDASVNARFAYPSGASGRLECSIDGDREELSYTVTGTRGSATVHNFILPHLDDRVTLRRDGHLGVEHLGKKLSYTYQFEAFAELIREGTPMPTDSDDAVLTMQLIDECYARMGMAERSGGHENN